MSTPPNWCEPLTEIGKWAIPVEEQLDIKLGHVQISPEYFTYHVPWVVIAKSIEQETSQTVLFVGSTLEEESAAATDLWFFSWARFTALLKLNREPTGDGPQGWRETGQPQGWIQNQILPSQVVIVLSIEPRLPVDCALALIAASQWIKDISCRPGASARLLALSPEGISLPFDRLMAYQFPGSLVTSFTLSCLNDEQPTKGCRIYEQRMPPDQLIKSVINELGNNDETHAVMCFPPWNRVDQLSNEGRLKKHFTIIELENSSSLKCLTQHLTPSVPRNIVFKVPNGFRSPVALDGFQRFHLVPGTTQQCPAIDPKTKEVMKLETRISLGQYAEQLAWAQRSNCDTSHVSIYTSGMDVLLQSPNGLEVNRLLDVENHHLGGFVAAVCDIGHWGFDVLAVLRCFVSAQQHLATAAYRLASQGILMSPTDMTLGMGLTPGKASAFIETLSLVGYDPRIAFFATTPSSNDVVATVKMQVAALLTEGLDVVRIDQKAMSTEAVLAERCWGYTRPLSLKGTMWLKLGLWKRLRNPLQVGRTQATPSVLEIDGVSIETAASLRIEKMLTKLGQTLPRHGVQVANESIDLESAELNEAQCLELQRDLLSAYVFQLATLKPVMDQDSSSHSVVECTHVASLTPLSSCPTKLLDLEGIRKQDVSSNLIFGVCEGLERHGTDTVVREWTWIPATVVLQWKLSQAPHQTLYKTLAWGC